MCFRFARWVLEAYFPCRDQLKRHYNLGQYWLQVDLEDLSSFDALLADKLSRLPAEYLPMVRQPLCFTQCSIRAR